MNFLPPCQNRGFQGCISSEIHGFPWLLEYSLVCNFVLSSKKDKEAMIIAFLL